MRCAVLANDVMKEELLSKKISSTVELIIVDSLDELFSVEADVFFDLEFLFDKERINQLTQLLPKPVFINSVVHTLQEIDRPFIRVNAWPTFLKRNVCEIAINENQTSSVKEIFEKMAWHYQIVPDVEGMVSARIIAMIINEAYYTLDDEVSTKTEIDIAMKLGTHYPLGPFEWCEKIGLKNIYELLLQLSKTESRYTIAKSLEKEINH